MSQNLSSASVVIGALRVKELSNIFDFRNVHGIMNTSGVTYFARDQKYS